MYKNISIDGAWSSMSLSEIFGHRYEINRNFEILHCGLLNQEVFIKS